MTVSYLFPLHTKQACRHPLERPPTFPLWAWPSTPAWSRTLPTSTAGNAVTRCGYGSYMAVKHGNCLGHWEILRKDKRQHDEKIWVTWLRTGQRVYVHVRSLKTGPAQKLARPFKDPYQVVVLHPHGAELQSVERPKAQPIRVSLNQVHLCPPEIRHGVINTPEPGPEDMQADISSNGCEGVCVCADDGRSEEPGGTAEGIDHTVWRGRLVLTRTSYIREGR